MRVFLIYFNFFIEYFSFRDKLKMELGLLNNDFDYLRKRVMLNLNYYWNKILDRTGIL
jgi:hypothetical protein